MKWFKKFLKLRKQNDYVKIIILFWIIGVYMVWSAIFHGISVYQQLSKPVEYILQPISEKVSKSELETLTKTKNIQYAGMQKQVDIQIKSINEVDAISCYVVSEKYLQQVFGIENKGSMKCYYLSPKLYNKILKQAKDKKEQEWGFQSEYIFGENENGIAKFVKIESNLPQEEEFAFGVGDTVELSREISGIRVYVKKQDLEGSVEKQIGELGYSIENIELLKENEYHQKEIFLEMKYEVIIGGLCFVAGIILMKLVKGQR